MKVTIKKLRALAKRAGVRMTKRSDSHYLICWPWNESKAESDLAYFRYTGTTYNLKDEDMRIEVMYFLMGIIAEREGLL